MVKGHNLYDLVFYIYFFLHFIGASLKYFIFTYEENRNIII
ncbi:hypothetical protein GGR42_002981 [Saonia flava]|uniref:Uncharacterized protein n=1 Tax=Saonia flava TaxID=523696 RepID=A0A846R002_9FLAO|nr:hypothetical protein [Saonia flava]